MDIPELKFERSAPPTPPKPEVKVCLCDLFLFLKYILYVVMELSVKLSSYYIQSTNVINIHMC